MIVIQMVSLDGEGNDVKELDRVFCSPGQAFRFDTGRAESLFKNRQAILGSVEAAIKDLSDWSNGYVLTRVVSVG